MTNAWWLGATHSMPQSESEVRSTLDPVRDDPQLSESVDAPTMSEPGVDNSSNLMGLAPRQVVGDVRPSERYRAPGVGTPVDYTSIIDDRISSSGYYARLEDQGEVGHGTIPYTIGITPEIRDGMAFGNEYFQVTKDAANSGAGEYMEPVADHWGNVVAGDDAKRAARQASLSSEIGKLFG